MTFGGAALLLAALAAPTGAVRPASLPHRAPSPVAAAAHNMHLSTLRLAIEGTAVTGRLRLFRDDLEAALRTLPRAATLTLREGALADSLVALYVGRTLTITADGTPAAFRITSSGLERDALSKQDVAWYILEATLPRAPRALAVLDRMLFERFPDQQNIVSVLKLPQDDRATLYFITGDAGAQTLRW